MDGTHNSVLKRQPSVKLESPVRQNAQTNGNGFIDSMWNCAIGFVCSEQKL